MTEPRDPTFIDNADLNRLREEIRSLRAEVRAVRSELDREKAALAWLTRTRATDLLPTERVDSRPAEPPKSRNRRFAPFAWIRGQSTRGEWTPPNALRWDAIALILITALAIATRFIDLTGSPPGIQGDEAAVGLEARHILNDGWIGLYSPAAAGTPTGYYLMAAPFVHFWGDTLLAVRLLSATLGVLTVVAFYVLLRRNLGFTSAVFGSVLFATFGWHLIFSRISLLTISWPFIAITGLVLLFEGIRSRRWEWWFGAGAVMALGLYTYNGHSLFLLVLGAFIAWTLFGWRALVALAGLASLYLAPGWLTVAAAVAGVFTLAFARQIRSRVHWEQSVGFAAGFGLAVYPMARWIRDNEEAYFGRGRTLSIFRDQQWTTLEAPRDKAQFIFDRYLEFWNKLTFDPRPEPVDTTGVVAIVPEVMLILMIVGIVFALLVRNTPLTRLGMIAIAVMPVASIAFTDLAVRRALIIAPFVAMFCAIALVELLRLAWRRNRIIRYASLAIVIALVGWISWQNLYDYFEKTNKSSYVEWALGPDLVEAVNFLNEQPNGAWVYFASNRWPISHEVVRWLGPEITGETRFAPYGVDSLSMDPTKGRPIWILMGPNQQRLAELQAMYPGGATVFSEVLIGPNQEPAYIAYIPPIPESP